MNIQFHYLVRGVIFADDKLLLAHQIGASNTFLPGGHVGSGERADVALVREIYEEIGMKAVVKRFVGVVEHVYPEDRLDNHEINLIFEAQIPELDSSKPLKSLEGHLEFLWADPSTLEKHNLLPYPMIECIANWSDDRNGYWGSTLRE